MMYGRHYCNQTCIIMAKFVAVFVVLSAIVLSALAAPAPQLFSYQQPAVASVSTNVLRTPGNLGQVSTYSKALDTPTSSVRKSDVRVSNDALAYQTSVVPAAYTAYHAPAAVAYHAPAPVATAYHAPVAAAPSLLGVAYSSAPAVTHISFDGFGAHYAY